MNSVRGLALAYLLAAASLDANAQLATSECFLTTVGLPGVSAECATLTVPENRADAQSRSIELEFARVPSLSADPREDGLIIIAGGPGQSTIDFYLSMRPAFESIRRDRDILLLDQRGTGRSAPLDCDGADAMILEDADASGLPALMRTCVDSLAANPRYYTTSVAVLDLETLREALGIEQWNLYGISYGTRVAQHYLRRFPEHTRAVILDGTVPSDVPLGPSVAVHAQRVLDRILARCVADTDCASRFPALAARLDALLAQLASTPVTVTLEDPLHGGLKTRRLTRERFTGVLRLLSYTPQTAALLPLLIDAADAGNFEPITAQSEMVAGELEAALSLPMHNAVVCTEDVPFFPADAGAGLDETYLGTRVVDALRAVCSVWPTGVLDADLRMPLESDKPVLLLVGDADPITPPDFARRVLEGLGNARLVVAPDQGHGLAAVGCIPRVMDAFLDRLAPRELDVACLDRASPSPFFLDFDGPAP